MPIPYKSKLIPLAKELRRNSTKYENRLWYDFLRNYPVRFQRQKAIDRFILDFYCIEAKLIVELDGSQHYEELGIITDIERTAILEEKGLMVLRYSNLEIQREFDGVCQQIDIIVKQRVENSTRHA